MKKGGLCLIVILSTLTWAVTAQETRVVWHIPDVSSLMDSLDKRTPEECNVIHSFVFKEGSKVDSVIIRVIRENFPSLEHLDLSVANYSDNVKNQDNVIPPYLFAHWYNLKAIDLPRSIKGIGEGAFYASGLVDVIHIPAAVKKLGVSTRGPVHFDEEDNALHGAFENCSLLRGVIFDEENGVSELEEIGIKTFSRCVNLATLSFPASLKKIQPMAFYHCRSLQRLSLPLGLVSLGDEWMALDTTRRSFGADEWERSHCGTAGAFSGCTGLSGNLTIPEGITFIPNGTFANCSGLDGILSIPSSVVVIGASAFDNCTNLHTNSSLDLSNVRHIGMGAFRNCRSLEGPLIFSDSPEIGCAAFAGCLSLESSLPEKLDTKGYVIGTSGSAQGFHTVKGVELDVIWGDYDFSIYYPEDAFQNTSFTNDEGAISKGVYVSPEHGDDTAGDGRSWHTAFRSFEHALQTLKDNTHWGRFIFIEETDQIIRFNSTISLDIDNITIRGGYLGHELWNMSPKGKTPTFRSNGPYPVFRITKDVKDLTLENLIIDGFETEGTLNHLISDSGVVLRNPNFKDTVHLYGDFTLDGTLTVEKHLFHKDGVVSFQWVDLNISDSLRLSLDGFAVIEQLAIPWFLCDSFTVFTVERPQGDILNENVLDEYVSMMIGSFDVPYADFGWKRVMNGKDGVYRLLVSTEIELRDLTVSPISPTLSSGGHTLQLNLSSEIPPILSRMEIEWSSDLPLVVKVDKNGLLTSGTDPGIATVTAIVRLPSTVEGEQGKEIGRIEVSVYVIGIIPAPHRTTVSLHSHTQLEATVYPSYIPNAELVWTSDNPGIATVNSSTGLVQTYGVSGDVLITATIKGHVSSTVTFPLKVAQLTTAISLTSSTVNKLTTGFIVDFVARCAPENVENKSVEWTISDTRIADFLAHTDTSCRIKAKKAGSIVLCAKAIDGSNVEVSYVIDVVEASTTNTILLSSSVAGKIETGSIVNFIAHRLSENTENTSVEWTILDTHIADFIARSDTSCRIQAKGIGSTVLYVKALDGSDVEVHYLLDVFKSSFTSLSPVIVSPVCVHYEAGILSLKGLNGHRGQILTVDGVVKSDFHIWGDEIHHALHLPAGIYLFRTIGSKVDSVLKFVVN
jgi:uncharacterized protein YjdB